MVLKALVLASAVALTGGCSVLGEPLTVALVGAGTSSAIGHNLNGTAYRTFTGPMEDVRRAALEALAAMGVRVDSTEKLESSEQIVGTAERRSIYVELEPITAKATRMMVVARNGGILYDASTATEIVLQTERVFLSEEEFASRGASRRVKAIRN